MHTHSYYKYVASKNRIQTVIHVCMTYSKIKKLTNDKKKHSEFTSTNLFYIKSNINLELGLLGSNTATGLPLIS